MVAVYMYLLKDFLFHNDFEMSRNSNLFKREGNSKCCSAGAKQTPVLLEEERGKATDSRCMLRLYPVGYSFICSVAVSNINLAKSSWALFFQTA